MTTTAISQTSALLVTKPSWWSQLTRRRNIMIGSTVMIIMLALAILAPNLTTYDPVRVVPLDRLKLPGDPHLFGTDTQGRDVFSRVIYGSRLSLTVGFGVSLVVLLAGTLVGLVAGYIRQLDTPLMRILDGMMAFPGIILAIAIMAARGAAVENVIIALAVVSTPRLARVVRSVVLSLSETAFVEAARATGCTVQRIIATHLLPNCVSPLIVQVSFIFAEAVIGEASLSFLGAGAPPEVPSWGGMLNDSRIVLSQAPWTMLFPGTALTLTVFGLNLLGDGLRDVLDPRLRRR
ncbi:MAG: ABC transporter permease [Chloroflexi bacterium]|nr:ABC transporter permease [Chloroflexota bacterium]